MEDFTYIYYIEDKENQLSRTNRVEAKFAKIGTTKMEIKIVDVNNFFQTTFDTTATKR